MESGGRFMGAFLTGGVSIEWHEFSNHNDLNWAESFHPLSIEICLNFSGPARLQQDKTIGELDSEHIAVYATGDNAIKARRLSGHIHRFFTLELSADYLRTQLSAVMEGVKPEIRDFVENPEQARSIIQVAPDAGACP